MFVALDITPVGKFVFSIGIAARQFELLTTLVANPLASAGSIIAEMRKKSRVAAFMLATTR